MIVINPPNLRQSITREYICVTFYGQGSENTSQDQALSVPLKTPPHKDKARLFQQTCR